MNSSHAPNASALLIPLALTRSARELVALLARRPDAVVAGCMPVLVALVHMALLAVEQPVAADEARVEPAAVALARGTGALDEVALLSENVSRTLSDGSD